MFLPPLASFLKARNLKVLDLSVVIPAYNEQFRLPSTITSVYGFLTTVTSNFEIIVVSDGSKDATAQVVEEFAKDRLNVRLIAYKTNRGKGYAVRTGVESAQGKSILIDDADNSSPIEEIQRLKLALDQGADIAIGSRAKPDPTAIVKALAYRTHMGNTFNAIVQGLILPGIFDTQCGFKLFKSEVAKDIFSVAKVDGYAFDVEILYIARLKDYVIKEVAINWANVAGSKVNVVTEPVKMLYDVLRIKMNKWLGYYDR